MAMTRKDFEAIAAVIRVETLKTSPDVEPLRHSSIQAIAEGIAAHATATNPSFNRQRFINACGLLTQADIDAMNAAIRR